MLSSVPAAAGFLAGADLSANAIERARRASSGYLDLTSGNPTRHGLIFPPQVLRTAAEPYWATRRYDPDPLGLPAAREAITRYYLGRIPPLRLQPDQVVITASTSEAYSLLFTLLADPGDNLLAPDVTYPLFEHLAAAHHVALRTYRLDESRGWQIDEASLLAQADSRTRAVLIVSPHNPTGMIVQRPVVALDQLGLPVICDEVFADFTYRAPHTPPFATLHPALPVFTLNGISKMFALPDLKLGWIAMNAPAAAMFGARLEILNDLYLGANSLTQAMLPALFANSAEFTAAMRRRIRASLDMALAMLAGCPVLRAQPPDGGYYLFAHVQSWDDEEALVLHLLERGVLVHPGFFYGCEDGAHLLISCLVEPEMLKRGIEIIIQALTPG
ncbi:MAG: pyridoxal phosphate-dependent aminotransferase [Chloroflexi bacterium]|jgi:aspartate/methionine/tyrosine aminotransferase|uniref:Pyridoxal phosphate-dependent aminotransferase n=1 Tax=Candidatus Thermofonsia Clade 3 bacterium TaxID=2364212 RepID=A0A2M8QBB8_9CHLR|nr:pyridoxal phosphate-dependent aminotransferase [Candidatus Roseilinea sp. NK_OTU-006]PJF47089.1 MAG: pyridoxal phosphate-dependent aminotransferase [Candidatus Thermofonsia Clade 3 bacterium]RMG63315.1 MAG: pyridoxal phosphate-dependent aminotransferase [Chloroflexota bacterium]